MSFEEHIRDIQRRLKGGDYDNEQSISQGVVLRLLREMGWPTDDTQLVVPEFPVKGGRVDFALCVKSKKPIIFIEVKQLGNTLGADEQLFNYAYKLGVPFAIITDGREWHFYLPAEAGSYDERRVYVLDLIERDVDESAYRLQRYLSFQQVERMRALEHAREDYKAVYKERETKENIPIAWEKLLEEKNESVTTVVSEKVESLCGYTPTAKQIIAYLSTLKPDAQDALVPHIRRKTTPMRERITPAPAQTGTTGKAARQKIKVTFPDGVEICHHKVVETFIEAIRKIGFNRVAGAGIEVSGHPMVSKQHHRHGEVIWTPVGSGFFVRTHSSTSQKMQQLTKINEQLGLGLKIEKV